MKSLLLATALLGSAGLALAQGMTAEHAWARFTVPGMHMGGVFMNVHNHTGQDDILIGASTPVASAAEVHETINTGNMMNMRPLPQGLALPKGSVTELKPGSYHVMLMGLKKELKVGSHIPLTLQFKHSRPLTIQVPVRKSGFTGQSATPMAH